MAKKILICLTFLFAINATSQRYKDYEIGPMVNYEHTTLYASNSIFIGGEGDDKGFSGFEPSYAAGVYFIYYFKPKFGLGTELYFQRTTSADLAGEYYNSITFMPYANFDPFRRIQNWYFGAGIGAAFIQESPDYGSRVSEADVNVITLPVKISTSYRVRNHITFELGAQTEILEVVKDNARRAAVYLGIKIPLNRLNRYYYR